MNHSKHLFLLITPAILLASGCQTVQSRGHGSLFGKIDPNQTEGDVIQPGMIVESPWPELAPRPEPAPKWRLVGSGSGFFVTEDGYFLTNHHVVTNADKVELVSDSISKVVARVVKTDPGNDLALLKAEGSFRPVRFQYTPKVRLGDRIFVMGFPAPDIQGTNIKATQGSVTGENGIQDRVTWFQMDASIQPGNSGGPVANGNGEVVGVAVATVDAIIIVKEREYLPQNVNYAVKAAYAIAFLNSTECAGKFLQARGVANDMTEAIEQLRQSTALVLVYKRENP